MDLESANEIFLKVNKSVLATKANKKCHENTFSGPSWSLKALGSNNGNISFKVDSFSKFKNLN